MNRELLTSETTFTRRDIVLGGLVLLGFACISSLEYQVQQLQGQLDQEKIDEACRDMELLRLTNEAREEKGLQVINYAVAGVECP